MCALSVDMCIALCTDICVDIGVDMCVLVGVCADMGIDLEMCMDMFHACPMARMWTCVSTCVDMSERMRVDMSKGIHTDRQTMA